MKRSVAVAAVATAAVVVAAGAAYAWHRRQAQVGRRSTPKAPPEGAPAPQQRAAEPAEGYETRWANARDAAITDCRADPQVRTFAQAVTCALNAAYPEASPWTDPGVWTSWMGAAAELVEASMLEAASRDGRPPRAWEMRLWVRGQRELSACDAGARRLLPRARALCAARRMYPDADWTAPARRFPWQQELVAALTDLAQEGAA